MTFETLTVIELLLSVSNYPEDKCDKIRDELSTMDKKAKAFDEIRNVDKDFYKAYGHYPNEEEWWYDASNIIEKYEELHGGQIKWTI